MSFLSRNSVNSVNSVRLQRAHAPSFGANRVMRSDFTTRFEQQPNVVECAGKRQASASSAAQQQRKKQRRFHMFQVRREADMQGFLYEKTALHIACQYGYLDVVQELLRENEINVNKQDYTGRTALSFACEKGYLQVVNALLRVNGIHINQADDSECTPLFYACAYGHVEVVHALLRKHGIDVLHGSRHGGTPLHIACANGHVDVVSALLAKDVTLLNLQDMDGTTPLHSACEQRQFDVVVLLLRTNGIDITVKRHREANSRYMLDSSSINPLFDIDEGGKLFINEACKSGHVEVVQALLRLDGIDVNHADSKTLTPLWAASRYDHVEIVKMLLRMKGIDVNKAHYQFTPLYVASERGHLDVVIALVKAKGIDLNKATSVGTTPLEIALRRNHSAIVKVLVYAGCDVPTDMTSPFFSSLKPIIERRKIYLNMYEKKERMLSYIQGPDVGRLLMSFDSFLNFCLEMDAKPDIEEVLRAEAHA